MTRNLGRIFREYSYVTEICVLKETADSRARRIFEILDVNDDGRKNTPKRLLSSIKNICFTQIVVVFLDAIEEAHAGEREREKDMMDIALTSREYYNKKNRYFASLH